MGRRPKGKPPVRHKLGGEWPRHRPICGADSWGFPEKWVGTEEWLHEIKACPKCKKLDPTHQGFDEWLKEKYGEHWNDYKKRRAINEKEIKKTQAERRAKYEIYLKDYSIKPNRYS